jgi:hypothetical protein
MLVSRSPATRAVVSAGALAALLLMDVTRAALLPEVAPEASPSVGHLVISEVTTGGAGASDEFVELYNPAPASLALDGLELVYVTASGATITRKATWDAGTVVPPGGHVLVANEAGIFAGLADATYAGGLASGGGSMALRTPGAASAVDAVGWGTVASTWLETVPAPAPPAGSSLERLPGGALGSGQDTDHNAVDFAVRPVPDPQNSTSPPVPGASVSPSPSDSPSTTETPRPTPDATATPDPTATPSPSVSPTPGPSSPVPSPSQTPTPTPTPTPPILTVAEARALPDGTAVVVSGVSLTASDFAEGGGYLADGSGGIAVLVEDGTFPRGVHLQVAGVVDDRFAQRTLRVAAADIVFGSPADEPEPLPVTTGEVGEPLEGRLVSLAATVAGTPTELSSGLAFEVDDGSGPIRVLVGAATGIETAAWEPGTAVTVIGVTGQRDSSGTGLAGYRVQPRDPADVSILPPPETPTPSPTPSAAATPTPSVTPKPTASPSAVPLVTVAQARRADDGARLRIRGVVILPTGLVEAGSAVVADASGAILVRTSSNLARLTRGQLVELSGSRSTKAGMVSLRVTIPPVVLGTQPEPDALRRSTGGIREADEALLVIVRGLVRDGPRRTSGGGLSFTLNDGSGPVRVFAAAGAGITPQAIPSGAWVELSGVVGQETSGAQPNAGYRLWPRDGGDIRIVARATEGGGTKPKPTPRATARPTRPPQPASPPPHRTIRPMLLGEPGSTPAGIGSRPLEAAARGQVPPIPLPLAAGLGGLAGLLVLAWRHGTWGRMRDELELRTARLRARMDDGDEEDESYTPAP